MMDRVVRLARWVGSQVGQMVPEHLAVCEFECRETTCTWADWRACRRRREMRPGGAYPRAGATRSATPLPPHRREPALVESSGRGRPPGARAA
jgi:hypothetical protein